MRRGFTLVELLVVIGIIAILVAVLLPMLSKARQSSNRVACRAQLKDVGNALQMYLNESKDRLPRVNPTPSISPAINDFPYLAEVFDPYTKHTRKVWRCPSDAITNDFVRAKNTELHYVQNQLNSDALTYFEREGSSYEYNTWINAYDGGLKFLEAVADARKVYGIDPSHLRMFNDYEPFHGKKGSVGSTNFLFADWHVGDLLGS